MITLKNISEKLNIPVSTISYALNDVFNKNKYISRKRRQLIKQTAAEMGYVVDDTARALATGKAKVIAFADSIEFDSYLSMLINPMTSTLDKLGYILFPIDVRGVDGDPSIYSKLFDACVRNRISGLIVRSMEDKNHLQKLKLKLEGQGIQLAVLANTAEVADCIHVKSCDFKAARKAVDYLYELGHRKVLFANNDITMQIHTEVRMRGFEERAKELRLDYSIITRPKPELQKSLAKVLDKSNKLRPTAIVCRGDSTGALIQSYLLYEHGIRCPEDYSIISFGGEASKSMYPRMTVIREPHEAMSKLVAQKIVARIEGKDYGPLLEMLEDELIIGATTVAPPLITKQEEKV